MNDKLTEASKAYAEASIALETAFPNGCTDKARYDEFYALHDAERKAHAALIEEVDRAKRWKEIRIEERAKEAAAEEAKGRATEEEAAELRTKIASVCLDILMDAVGVYDGIPIRPGMQVEIEVNVRPIDPVKLAKETVHRPLKDGDSVLAINAIGDNTVERYGPIDSYMFIEVKSE